MIRLASSHKLFRPLLQRSTVLLFPSDAGVPCQNGKEIIGWISSPQNISFSLYTYQGQWYEGDSHLSFRNPFALAECWRNYFNNQILDVIHNLWKDYRFIGSAERIFVFCPRLYATAISRIQFADHSNPRSFIIPGKILEYKPFLYCGVCNQYAIYHEHEYNHDPPWDPYDSYPSYAHDTN